jgi:catechol 2,3-dioxygenase-like lactoylglutathione lyase family enzyme
MAEARLFERIDTVIVRVRDIEAAKRWYREKLGLEPTFEDDGEQLAVLGCGGTSLTLWQWASHEAAPSPADAGCYPIFSAVDVEQAWRTLRTRGVTVEPVTDAGGVRWFRFRDLDGNQLEACQVL